MELGMYPCDSLHHVLHFDSSFFFFFTDKVNLFDMIRLIHIILIKYIRPID